MKYTVTVDQAMRKGGLQLFWIPMSIIVLFIVAEIILFKTFDDGLLLFLIFVGPILGWLWWSMHVVKWKIWAFTNVADIHRLEQKAIRKKIIWKRGSFWEKTEFASAGERERLTELLKRFDEPRIVEVVDDNRFFSQYTIGFSKLIIVLGLMFMAVGVWLLSSPNYDIRGLASLIIGLVLLISVVRKILLRKFFMQVDDSTIEFGGGNKIKWSDIETFFIKQEGSGRFARYYVIIKGKEVEEKIAITDAASGPDFIEDVLGVYYNRYLKKVKR